MVRGKWLGWLAIVVSPVLLQACVEKPSGPSARLFNADVTGGAKNCAAPKITPVAGQTADAAIKVGNDGGWCGITVNNNGKPFDAGLLTMSPAHGKVQIHTVGNDTRIDYTPTPRFAGQDAFTVKLIPGDATIRVTVTVAPS